MLDFANYRQLMLKQLNGDFMNLKTREMFLQIIDGDQRLLPIMYQAYRFVRCDEILTYLVGNKITGNKLLEYYITQNSSPLNLMSDILRRVDKNKQKQKVLAHKDYII